MKWQPLGVVYRTDSWAQTPTPLVLADRTRMFVAARDSDGKSFTKFVDLDRDDPTKVLGESGCVLGRGKPGCFDQDGSMPSFAAQDSKGNVWLYYSGWTACKTTPYHNATGVAVTKDSGLTFERVFEGPILDRAPEEPYLAVTPCLFEGRMWYVGGLRWQEVAGKWEPIYCIHVATLTEDLNFARNGVAMPQSFADECFSRPWVFKTCDKSDPLGVHWMIYSFRNANDYRDGPGAYRLGCAFSLDRGLTWKRLDEQFNLPRTPGFDDTMQAYAATFETGGKTFMVYNGNSFGRYGFALAVLT